MSQSKRQLKKMHRDLNPQWNRQSDFVALSGSLALYCMASEKHDDCLIANDNSNLWFLVILLLLVRNDLIQLVKDNTGASLGLLRTVANFFKTLNRQISFLKQTNILKTRKWISVLLSYNSNRIRLEVLSQHFCVKKSRFNNSQTLQVCHT